MKHFEKLKNIFEKYREYDNEYINFVIKYQEKNSLIMDILIGFIKKEIGIYDLYKTDLSLPVKCKVLLSAILHPPYFL